MICQLFANLKRKKRGTYEILAGGGRFDSLISSFASRLNIVDQDRSSISPPCGVGMSIGLGTISSHVFTNSVNASIRFFFTKIYIFTFLRESIFIEINLCIKQIKLPKLLLPCAHIFELPSDISIMA